MYIENRKPTAIKFEIYINAKQQTKTHGTRATIGMRRLAHGIPALIPDAVNSFKSHEDLVFSFLIAIFLIFWGVGMPLYFSRGEGVGSRYQNFE